MPFARISSVVVGKFNDAISDAMQKIAMLVIHRCRPHCSPGPADGSALNGAYPSTRATAFRRSRKTRDDGHERDERCPERKHVQHRKRHIRRPNLNRQKIISEPALRPASPEKLAPAPAPTPAPRSAAPDWRAVVRQVAVSRALDDLEESTLLPERKVLYQFSARGHDVTQVLLGSRLTGARDAVVGYYRSRPLLLTLGLSIDEALASSMMRVGGMSEGRDIGVVFNFPRREAACALPVCGGVGTQYTPAAGWAQALRYRHGTLGEAQYAGSIAVAHGGDASTATNGFWAALNIATTERLPLLFFIEDNGYGISVPSQQQTPGGNIARNLSAFRGLRVLDGDGSDPMSAARLIEDAVSGVRAGDGPALLRLTVPRLSGHSGQDTQTYKGPALIAAEQERDPWRRLRAQVVPQILTAEEWDTRSEPRTRGGGRCAGARRALQRARPCARQALCVHRIHRRWSDRHPDAGRSVGGRCAAARGLGAGPALKGRGSIW